MRFWTMKSLLSAPLLAALVTTALTGASVPSACAASDDRKAAQAADDILATLRALPGDRGDLEEGSNRRVCLRLGGDAIHSEAAWPMSAVILSRYTAGVEPGTAYNADTAGVLLGDGPRGITPTPFVQALMAAGVVRRVPVSWVVHTSHPGMPTAAQLGLHDLDDSSEPKPSSSPPDNVEATTRFEGDLFLGSGPEIVGHFEIPPDERGHIGAVSIPPLIGTASPPSGVTSASRYCYALVPQRVLEFGPLQTVEPGHQRITVAVLMTPEQVPGWSSDPRVLEVFAPQFIRPQQVFLATFDNFGDGWKKFGLTFAKDLAETGHYVEG
ncbi:hypothetical protein LOC54_06145 [Acetobacter sp. AN02]|uniref:hypothetical protein n=1 Tax=Acetobacter sp. AN02 TaxID=2894186 RepID=UPI0024341FD9|nr:hypothetical protein [Acetobacter sp. AN02]MDG6094691.1 hypothetical protein [Acetobacter sp. AN02]